MSMEKLQKAKERFDAAKSQHSDPAAVNWTADGLSHLTDALMDIQRELSEIRSLITKGRGQG